MAKITIAGNAVVVTMSTTLEDIKTLEKYRPKALSLFETDEDGCKEEVFAIQSVPRSGVVTQYGACFADATRDDNKFACVTMAIPSGIVDATEYVSDLIGTAILKMNKIEASIPAALAEIAAEKATIAESITFMG